MSLNTEDFVKIINQIAEPMGFVRRKKTWYRFHPEATLVCHMEKSQWGDRYAVNMSVALAELLPEKYPPEEKCHIKVGLEWLTTGQENGSQVLDLEDKSLSQMQREGMLRDGLRKGLSWLEGMSTERGIAKRLQSDEALQRRSTLESRQHQGIGGPPR